MSSLDTIECAISYTRCAASLAGYFLSSGVSASLDRAVEYLGPIIEDRKQKIKEYGKNYSGKPVRLDRKSVV